MPPRDEWYGPRGNGTYGRVDPRTVLTRPADYVPFQSMPQPDGRHAYNPWGRQYPQFGVLVEPWQRVNPQHPMPAFNDFPPNREILMGLWEQTQQAAQQAQQAQLAHQAWQAQLDQQA